jgi:hypothetical protein
MQTIIAQSGQDAHPDPDAAARQRDSARTDWHGLPPIRWRRRWHS